MHLCISYYDRIVSAMNVCPKYGFALLLQLNCIEMFYKYCHSTVLIVTELNCIDCYCIELN